MYPYNYYAGGIWGGPGYCVAGQVSRLLFGRSSVPVHLPEIPTLLLWTYSQPITPPDHPHLTQNWTGGPANRANVVL